MVWIDAKKRLPKIEEQSAIVFDGQDILLDIYYSYEMNEWVGEWEIVNVTHWFMMPDPPMEKNVEEAEFQLISTSERTCEGS